MAARRYAERVTLSVAPKMAGSALSNDTSARKAPAGNRYTRVCY